MHARLLRATGARVAEATTRDFAGVNVPEPPHVVLAPSFSPSFAHLRAKLPTPDRVAVAAGATLVVEGSGVELRSVDVRGALVLRAAEGVRVGEWRACARERAIPGTHTPTAAVARGRSEWHPPHPPTHHPPPIGWAKWGDNGSAPLGLMNAGMRRGARWIEGGGCVAAAGPSRHDAAP